MVQRLDSTRSAGIILAVVPDESSPPAVPTLATTSAKPRDVPEALDAVCVGA